RVPILPGDDEPALAARVLEQEHKLYADTLATFCRGL
ncbi:MAG: phosphoribosylglycinamide formyltransferase, partial [Caulobacter sp.]